MRQWIAKQRVKLNRLKNDLVIESKNMGVVPDTAPELKCELGKMMIDVKLNSLSNSGNTVIAEIIKVLKPLLDVYNAKLSSSAGYGKRVINKLRVHRYYIEKELISYLRLEYQLERN